MWKFLNFIAIDVKLEKIGSLEKRGIKDVW
jgi:hypothetical protein